MNDPVRRAYELYNKFAGRQSWDLTAVLAAVRDPKLYWDVKKDGYNQVGQDGKNVWTPTPHRGHSCLVTKIAAGGSGQGSRRVDDRASRPGEVAPFRDPLNYVRANA